MLLSLVLIASLVLAQAPVDLAPVVSKPMSRTIELPAELAPYLAVSLRARISGYVERVLVDRGSVVKQGDLLMELSAPEIEAQLAEADAKIQTAEADRVQAPSNDRGVRR